MIKVLNFFRMYEKYGHPTDCKFVIDVSPVSAVRMTMSDRWKVNPNHPNPKYRQRKSVTKYFEYKNKVLQVASKYGYKLQEELNLVFVMPLPESWSNKKKKQYDGQPHKSRPDVDNLTKAFMDALSSEDGNVYSLKVTKVYGYEGKIIIY